MADPAVQDPVDVRETPEFKEALKAERETLEKNIRESNQKHLDEEKRKLEALHGPPTPRGDDPKPAGKDWFAGWGEKHGLPPEAGLELAEGIVDYIDRTKIAPLGQSQRRSELRLQRQDVRASDPTIAAMDDKYHEEVGKLLESVKSIRADSYAMALELIIGRHFKDELAEDRKTRQPEDPTAGKPGPMPIAGSPPKPKGKVALTEHQKSRAEEMGLSEEAFIEQIQNRITSMKGRSFSEPTIRQQLGKDIGTLTV